MMQSQIETGSLWRHWKGEEYEVVALARDADRGDIPIVVYIDVKGNVWTRTLRSWNATVKRGGNEKPRFVRIT